MILLEEPCRPRLLDANHAGSAWTRDTDELLKSWIEGEPTLYVGKAGAKRSGLRGRTSALIRFSQNGRASHRGGYRLWQVNGHETFVLGWKCHDDPRWGEHDLAEAFRQIHKGQLPFANVAPILRPKHPRLASGH